MTWYLIVTPAMKVMFRYGEIQMRLGEFQKMECYTFLAEQLVDSAYHSQHAPESNRRGFKPSLLKILFHYTCDFSCSF